MAFPIIPVSSVIPPISTIAVPALASAAAGSASASPFGSVLTQAINQVESFQTNADASVNRFLSGEGEEIHKVALATQQADLSFQLFLQVRNKVVSAYQQVMQMQV
jgi:flagellar hook-basal body complex protein FliE